MASMNVNQRLIFAVSQVPKEALIKSEFTSHG